MPRREAAGGAARPAVPRPAKCVVTRLRDFFVVPDETRSVPAVFGAHLFRPPTPPAPWRYRRLAVCSGACSARAPLRSRATPLPCPRRGWRFASTSTCVPAIVHRRLLSVFSHGTRSPSLTRPAPIQPAPAGVQAPRPRGRAGEDQGGRRGRELHPPARRAGGGQRARQLRDENRVAARGRRVRGTRTGWRVRGRGRKEERVIANVFAYGS